MMIPFVKDILNLLNRIAPFDLAEEWDNSGLQIGSPDQSVNKILVALDPSLEVVREALSQKAQLLLTHHPLIFKGIARINLGLYPGQVIAEAIKGDLSIVATHTNLDLAEKGINQILAQLFELQNVETLLNNNQHDYPLSGLGRIGNLTSSRPLGEIAKWIKDKIGATHVSVIGQREKPIRRVAVVGGSGGSMVTQAFHRGADLLITGDIGHHDSLTALSLGISLIDSGHFFSEWSALRIFKDSLQREMVELGWEIQIEFLSKETCPHWYV